METLLPGVGRRQILSERLSSEVSWRPERITPVDVEIAGIRLRLECQDPEVARWISGFYREYRLMGGPSARARGTADAVIRIHAQPATEPTGLWEDEDSDFHIQGSTVVHRDFCARKLTARNADAWIGPVVDDAVMNLFRWFLPPLLADRGVLLLHGAAVERDGKGYAFFGQSGAGKSTTVASIAAADPLCRLLGDDVVFLAAPGKEWGRDQARVMSAPLGCGYSHEAPEPVDLPLAGLFSLEQAPEDRVLELRAASGALLLTSCAMSAGFASEAADLLRLSSLLAASAPGVRKLRLRKGPEFWFQTVLPGCIPQEIRS